MEKLYEVETEKIRIKYEKLIGLTEISNIVLDNINNCYHNIPDFIKQQMNEKYSLYSFLNDVVDMYNKENSLTYFSTSKIHKFKNIKINMKQDPNFTIRNQIMEYTIDACIIWFDNGHTILVKESAEEVKKLYEK